MQRKQLKGLATWGLLVLFALISFKSVQAQHKTRNEEETKSEAPAPMKLKVGDMAPEFSLLAFDGKDPKKISLQDYRGKKNIALAFFVFAFYGWLSCRNESSPAAFG